MTTEDEVRKRTEGLGFSDETIKAIAADVDRTLQNRWNRLFFGPVFGGRVMGKKEPNLFGIIMLIGMGICAYYAVQTI